MRLAVVLVLGVLLVSAFGRAAGAHEPSNAYLDLEFGDEGIGARLDLALRDLEVAVALDRDGDHAITWGELREQRTAIAAYVLARLELSTDDVACSAAILDLEVARRPEETFAAIHLRFICPDPKRPVDLRYGLMFDQDPLHRGLVTARVGDRTISTVLAPDRREWRLEQERGAALTTMRAFFIEGIHHISIGLDHLLFLVLLLLASVVHFNRGSFRPVSSFRDALVSVAGIVTAFTLAHSITLGFATFGLVSLPARGVEVAIAASIVLAALNNIRPVVTRNLALVAFGFGLVHGLGFATALAELNMNPADRALALLGFNFGIEAGQLALVAVAFPLAFVLSRSGRYPLVVLRPGSAAIAVVAMTWLIDRAVNPV